MRALNIFGAVALVLLGLYIGWTLVHDADERSSGTGVQAATPPASR